MKKFIIVDKSGRLLKKKMFDCISDAVRAGKIYPNRKIVSIDDNVEHGEYEYIMGTPKKNIRNI